MKNRILMFALLSFVCLPLLGQSGGRHLDFTKQLLGVDGVPLQNGDAHPQVPLTLGDAAVMALETQAQNETLTGLEKFKLDALARKIYKQKDVALTMDEIVTIKDRIGKIEPAIVVGASWSLLDPQ